MSGFRAFVRKLHRGHGAEPPNLRVWFSAEKECILHVREGILPQVEAVKYLWVLFMSEGRIEQEVLPSPTVARFG